MKKGRKKDGDVTTARLQKSESIWPEPEVLNLQRAIGNRATGQILQNRLGDATEDHPPPFAVTPAELTSLLGQGKPLPADMQALLFSKFGEDFSDLRLHDDARGDHVAKSLGAEALSFGRDIALQGGEGRLQSPEGRELLVHEGRHIASGQTTSGANSTGSVQLKVTPDDITEEMIGLSFKVLSDQGTGSDKIPNGSSVVVTDWKGTSNTATVEFKSGGKTIKMDVPKLELEPEGPSVKGFSRYTLPIKGQRKAVKKAADDVTEQEADFKKWKDEEKNYKKKRDFWKKNIDESKKELDRRKDVLGKKEAELSRMLLRETMFQRFDPVIKQWVDHYNTLLKPDQKLDPNILKSMLFQETRGGTEGEHLEIPPLDWSDPQKHPLRSRFNIIQALDSTAHQQMLMIEEMSPTIFTKYGLDKLKKEITAKDKTEAEMFAWDGGKIVGAMKELFAARDAGQNLNKSSAKDLNLDYSYWIRTAVRWLFYKYSILPKKTRTWEEAARKYNGGGEKADLYKKDVVRRLGKTEVDVEEEERVMKKERDELKKKRAR